MSGKSRQGRPGKVDARSLMRALAQTQEALQNEQQRVRNIRMEYDTVIAALTTQLGGEVEVDQVQLQGVSADYELFKRRVTVEDPEEKEAKGEHYLVFRTRLKDDDPIRTALRRAGLCKGLGIESVESELHLVRSGQIHPDLCPILGSLEIDEIPEGGEEAFAALIYEKAGIDPDGHPMPERER